MGRIIALPPKEKYSTQPSYAQAIFPLVSISSANTSPTQNHLSTIFYITYLELEGIDIREYTCATSLENPSRTRASTTSRLEETCQKATPLDYAWKTLFN